MPLACNMVRLGSMVPLVTDDNGVKPIAVDDFLRRLVGRLLMFRAKHNATTLLAPTKLGIYIASLAKAMKQAIHRILWKLGAVIARPCLRWTSRTLST